MWPWILWCYQLQMDVSQHPHWTSYRYCPGSGWNRTSNSMQSHTQHSSKEWRMENYKTRHSLMWSGWLVQFQFQEIICTDLKSHVLLYPGGLREALHRRVYPVYDLFERLYRAFWTWIIKYLVGIIIIISGWGTQIDLAIRTRVCPHGCKIWGQNCTFWYCWGGWCSSSKSADTFVSALDLHNSFCQGQSQAL